MTERIVTPKEACNTTLLPSPTLILSYMSLCRGIMDPRNRSMPRLAFGTCALGNLVLKEHFVGVVHEPPCSFPQASLLLRIICRSPHYGLHRKVELGVISPCCLFPYSWHASVQIVPEQICKHVSNLDTCTVLWCMCTRFHSSLNQMTVIKVFHAN